MAGHVDFGCRELGGEVAAVSEAVHVVAVGLALLWAATTTGGLVNSSSASSICERNWRYTFSRRAVGCDRQEIRPLAIMIV